MISPAEGAVLVRASFWTIASRWSLGPQVVVPLAMAASLYVSGVRRVRRRRPAPVWKGSRTACFLLGIAVLFLALASPIDPYSDALLSVHMAQHMLLTLIAPPLLLLGRPVTLALAASSGSIRSGLAGLAHGHVGRTLGSPLIDFGAFAVVMWASHFTPLYEATLTDQRLHALEHIAFLTAALLFWWPIVARDPGAGRLSHPARLLYLFLCMPVMSLLGFVIASSDRVLYPHYGASSPLLGVSALVDQRLAGTIMWEGSMLVSIVALSAVLLDWMERDQQEALRTDARLDHLGRGSRTDGGGMNAEPGRG